MYAADKQYQYYVTTGELCYVKDEYLLIMYIIIVFFLKSLKFCSHISLPKAVVGF